MCCQVGSLWVGGSLTAVFGGIITALYALVTYSSRDYFEIYFLCLVIIFGRQFKNAIRTYFAIAMRAYVPILILILFAIGEELHKCRYAAYDDYSYHNELFTRSEYEILIYAKVVFWTILSVYLFNRVYRKNYVHPVV